MFKIKYVLGLLLGRRSCQRLNVNREYIVFLEPFFDGTYRPVDFEEIEYNNQINILLEKTCGLLRIYPFTKPNDTEAIFTNKCPSAVSIDCPLGLVNKYFFLIHFYIYRNTETTIAPSTTTTTTSFSTTTSTMMLTRDFIDFEALSLLLAEHEPQNLSLAFLKGQNHKSLFSDDDARQNQANHYSSMIITSLIQCIFCSILRIFK